jgi:hypothetical protein
MKPASPTKKKVIGPIRLLVFVLILATAVTHMGQTQKILDPPRVLLDYRCPSYVLSGNAPIIMRAEIMGARSLLDDQEAKRIVLRWRLSKGRLVSGQGTGTIMVDPSGVAKNGIGSLEVKLEIENAPPDLEREKTCKLKVDPDCNLPAMFDEYGSLSHEDEAKYLDRFAEYLKHAGSASIAYICSYSGRRACLYEGQWRADRAKNYLVERHSIPSDRIIAVDGGFRENWNVDLFIQSHGTCGPMPSPTLQRDDAHVSGQCSEKYKDLVGQ